MLAKQDERDLPLMSGKPLATARLSECKLASVFQWAILSDGLILATLRLMSEIVAAPLIMSPQAR